MVHYKVETVIKEGFAEKICTSYLSFPTEEYAKKYFTNMKASFKECRKYLTSNRIGEPTYTQVAYRQRQNAKNSKSSEVKTGAETRSKSHRK